MTQPGEIETIESEARATVPQTQHEASTLKTILVRCHMCDLLELFQILNFMI
jgi:hypothetical protein